MAYDRTKEQTLVISKAHHTMVKIMAEYDKRKLKNELELLIEQAYAQHSSKITNKPS